MLILCIQPSHFEMGLRKVLLLTYFVMLLLVWIICTHLDMCIGTCMCYVEDTDVKYSPTFYSVHVLNCIHVIARAACTRAYNMFLIGGF